MPLPILVCLLVCPLSLWMSDNKVEIFCYEKELWIFCLASVKRIPRHGLDNLKTDCLRVSIAMTMATPIKEHITVS